MKPEPITRERIDELLAFLPLFDSDDLSPTWHGPKKQDGVFLMPCVTYPSVVEQFYEVAGQPCWSDYGYRPETAEQLVFSDGAVATATLAEIKIMLTYCVRGERFCTGHWSRMIREGRIGAILRRLGELREFVN